MFIAVSTQALSTRVVLNSVYPQSCDVQWYSLLNIKLNQCLCGCISAGLVLAWAAKGYFTMHANSGNGVFSADRAVLPSWS